MFESFVPFLNFVINTPLFYLIGVFFLIGYMYLRVRKDMQGIQKHGERRFSLPAQPVPLTMKQTSACERCGGLSDHLAEVQHADRTSTLLCASCRTQTRGFRTQRGQHQMRPFPLKRRAR